MASLQSLPCRQLLVGVLLLTSSAANALDLHIPGLVNEVTGSGRVIDAARSVGPFRRILHEGSFDVVVTPTGTPSVRVQGDDNLVDLILAEVRDGTLRISSKPRSWSHPSSPLVVRVGTPRLDGVKLLGSGNLRIEGLSGSAFDCELLGSGDISATGKVQQLNASVLGSGDIHLAGVQADTVRVTVTGSGDAEVQATELLDAHITGSGDVRYRGHPRKVEQHVTGSGDLKGGL